MLCIECIVCFSVDGLVLGVIMGTKYLKRCIHLDVALVLQLELWMGIPLCRMDIGELRGSHPMTKARDLTLLGPLPV